jgi:hypothetical protein
MGDTGRAVLSYRAERPIGVELVDHQPTVGWWLTEFDVDAPTTGGHALPNRLVLVPVDELDLRTLHPLAQAWRIPALERRAVHVVCGESAAGRLTEEWTRSKLSVPLFLVEDDGGVAATIARVVSVGLASGFDEVVVLVGRLRRGPRRRRLLRGRTSDTIARRLSRVPGVQVGLLTIAPP